MYKNDQKLSLNENTFAQMKEDFDSILNRTIGNMEMKGADEATVTLKLVVKLEKTTTFSETGPLDVTRPNFKHDISSVMQVKDKKSGQLNEEMALVFDEALGEYVLRPIRDGQMTIDDYVDAQVVDADFTVDNSQKAIAGPGVPQLEQHDDEDDEIEEPFGDDDDEEESEDQGEEAPTRYDNLIQYVDEELTVVEEEGVCKVVTGDGEVVLTTDAPKGDVLHVSEALLKDLVGETVACVEYEVEGKTVSVAVECESQGVVIAEASNPDAEE